MVSPWEAILRAWTPEVLTEPNPESPPQEDVGSVSEEAPQEEKPKGRSRGNKKNA